MIEPAALAPTDRYERLLVAQGFTKVAGADEAGRGALAGPLVAAAVVLPAGFDVDGINDSKVLTEPQREAAYERIVASATWVACKAEPGVIDAGACTARTSRSSGEPRRRSSPTSAHRRLPGARIPCPSIGVKKGDAVSVSVALPRSWPR